MGFTENLKAEIKYQGIQIKELAAKTGINKNTLCNYLTGHNSIPNAEAAVKIATALNVSVEYLVTGSNFPKTNPHPTEIELLVKNIETLDDIDKNSLKTLITSMKQRYR